MTLPRGIAVMGVTGGCGATTLAAALAMSASPPGLRVLALDGHGGGPHVPWGMAPERTVDDLRDVRDEVDVPHVAHIVHRMDNGCEVVVGPASTTGMCWWDDAAADRLVTALVAVDAWVADLGRGDHAIGTAVARAAGGLVIAAPCTATGAHGVRQAIERLPARPAVIALAGRADGDRLSPRAFRRVIGGVPVVDVPWPPRVGRRSGNGVVAALRQELDGSL